MEGVSIPQLYLFSGRLEIPRPGEPCPIPLTEAHAVVYLQ
jgi:hypothetical protein